MIEKCLIEHCAPTLASLKAANLFNACCEAGENIELQLAIWNQMMNPKGVKLMALRKWEITHLSMYTGKKSLQKI